MSGIVGIVNFDGAPIDRALLSRMTASLDFRGPDARRIWIAEPTRESGTNPCVGFGHTLLRTTYEAEHEQQPFTLDGNTWIVADCRVDAREELLAKLRAKGRDASLHRPDVELILHAWHVWGEECVEHLLGDLAFAIWDAPRRRLFCARDHMGVKPFYYALIGSTLIFSNTLDCVRMHPAVSDKLNDLAIADFLLFGLNQENDTTSFVDVRRIPPAHAASLTTRGLESRCYWTLPIDEPVYFKRLDDYTDRFKELLRDSVSDRLRTDKVGVLMSGGLDSPTLAATARECGAEVRAFTTVWKGYDDERHYAGLVANHLLIPINFWERTEDPVDPRWFQTAFHTPEPVASPLNLASDRANYQRIAAYSRVQFYGEGPDNALDYEWRPYLRHLLDNRKYKRLIYDLFSLIILHRRVPLLTSLGRIIRGKRRGNSWRLEYPPWVNSELDSRLRLRTRWKEWQGVSPSPHRIRPAGYHSLGIPDWQAVFEQLDIGLTLATFEVRHPFMDLRLLRYMLSVPVIPWCRAKYLERRAMRGTLPRAVLKRSKAPFPRDPVWEQFAGKEFPRPENAHELAAYVDLDGVSSKVGANAKDFQTDLRPLTLSYWLRNMIKTGQNIQEESLRGQQRNSSRRSDTSKKDLRRAPVGGLR